MTLRSQHACCQLSAQMPEGFCTFACIFAPLCGLYRIFASLRMRRAIANISPSFRGVCELRVQQPVSRDKTSFVRLFCFNPPKGGKESKDNGQEKRTNGWTAMERLLRRSCSLTYVRGGIGVKWSGNERGLLANQRSLAAAGEIFTSCERPRMESRDNSCS